MKNEINNIDDEIFPLTYEVFYKLFIHIIKKISMFCK